MLNALVLLDIPMGTMWGREGQDWSQCFGPVLEQPDAGLWVCMEGRGEQEKGHQPPVHSLHSVGQGKEELLPCTTVSTVQLREAPGAGPRV